MNLQEFITKTKENGNNILWFTKEGGLKTYLPITIKQLMVEEIMDVCTETNENGTITINFLNKKINTDFLILCNYCDVQIEEENINIINNVDELELTDEELESELLKESIFEYYDYLEQYEIIDQVKSLVGKDVKIIEEFLEAEINNMKFVHNSIESVLATGLKAIVDKVADPKTMKGIISTLSKEIPKAMNKIKPENLDIISKMNNSNILPKN
jgi:hypothetical protein